MAGTKLNHMIYWHNGHPDLADMKTLNELLLHSTLKALKFVSSTHCTWHLTPESCHSNQKTALKWDIYYFNCAKLASIPGLHLFWFIKSPKLLPNKIGHLIFPIGLMQEPQILLDSGLCSIMMSRLITFLVDLRFI